MSDRRRNFFVLLTVVGLLAASLVVIFTKETKLGLDLQGGVQLVFQGKPTKQQPEVTPDGLDRALDIMRERVDTLGVAEPELQRSGADQIDVSLPGVADPERAADIVGTTAQLYFYDWEPNILDEDCKTNPDSVNGGAAGDLRALQRRPARVEVPAGDRQQQHGRRQQLLRVRQGRRTRRSTRASRPRASRISARAWRRPARTNFKILEVPEGVIVVRAPDERTGDQRERGEVDQWWVLKDNPVLNGNEIKNPEQNFENGAGGAPIVTMEFSDKGREAFAQTTREIAQRGADNAALNGGLQNPIAASHHFAIRLDNELISTPYINFRENPDGIDGSQGAQISGGFTLQGAQDLARLLKIGALPLRLELISRSQVSATLGQQALDQGLTAGLAGFAIVAMFLLVFYRVLGVIAVVALGDLRDLPLRADQADPDHDDAAGHRGPDPHDRRGGGREHRRLRTRQRGDTRTADRYRPASRRATRRASRRSSTRTSSRCSSPSSSSSSRRQGSRASPSCSASARSSRSSPRSLATQAILLSMRGSRVLQRPSALGAAKQRKPITFDFMGWSRWFFSMSGVILLICALAIGGKGLNFGIDFESGTRITAALEKPATVEQVRDAIGPAGFGDAKIQTIKNPELGNNVVQISAEESGKTAAGHQRARRRVRHHRRPGDLRDRADVRRSPSRTRRSWRSSPRCS